MTNPSARACRAIVTSALAFAAPPLVIPSAPARAEVPKRSTMSKPGATGALAFDRESRLVAAGAEDGSVTLWFTDSGRELRTFSVSSQPIRALVFAADGNVLYATGDDGKISAWDPATGAKRIEVQAHSDGARALAITPLGDLVASAGLDGKVALLETATGTIRGTHQHSAPIHDLCFSADGRYLGLASPRSPHVRGARAVQFVELERGVVVRTLDRHPTGANAVAIASEGEVAASGGEDGLVTLIGTTNYELEEPLRGHAGPVRSLSFRPDGKLLASGGDDGIVLLWGVRGRSERDRAPAGAALRTVRFSPNGRVLGAADVQGRLSLFDVSGLERDAALPAEQEALATARERLAEQKMADALAAAKRAMELAPRSAAAQALAGRIHLAESRIQEAVAAFEAAQKLDPEEPISATVLGIVAREQGQLDQAAVHFKRALIKNPSNPEAYTLMAAMQLKRGDYGSAGRNNLAALDLAPSDSSLFYNLACTYSVGRQSKRALDWLEAAFRADYRGFDWVDQDPDLDNLRSIDRYRKLMTEFGKSGEFFGSGGSPSKADELKKKGDDARKVDDHATALGWYRQAIAEERSTPQPRLAELRIMMLWMGAALDQLGEDEAALFTFQESAALGRNLYLDDNVVRFTMTLMAKLHARLDQKAKAEALYREAIQAHTKHGEKDMAAKNLARLAGVLTDLGRYDKALEHAEESIATARSLSGETAILVDGLEQRATIEKRLGQRDKALATSREALALVRTLSDRRELSTQLTTVGDLLAESGDLAGAIALFEEAVRVAEQDGNPRVVALAMEHFARFYASRGRIEDASRLAKGAVEKARASKRETSLLAALSASGSIEVKAGRDAEASRLYAEALVLARRLGREATLASVLALAADVERRLGRLDAAMKLLEEAMALRRKQQELPALADVLQKIAHVRFEENRFEEASNRLSEAVQIFEQLRKRAKGEARREYLASQIFTYRFLILTQLKADKTFDAYRTLELSRAKMLAEKLALEESDATIPTIPELQELAGQGAILTYGNSDWGAVAAFTIDEGGILPRVRGLSELIEAGMKEYGAGVRTSLQGAASGKRGLKSAAALAAKSPEESGLSDLVHYYRWLLSNPSVENDATAKRLGRLLYKHLVEPMEARLAGKRELLVVPDGVLALLPFETLIDGEGRYLIERFDVRYAQSLSVLRLIAKRVHPRERKPILAFGGAVYGGAQVADGGGARGLGRYEALGYSSWDPLPGTLEEVRGISRIVRGADVMEGASVEEGRVKGLSASGQLAKYRVLHFATHGLVVPEAPELSALVLSQGAATGGEDGYLDMAEIARLRLSADFVALSACETGVGRIYGGEGVVGLAQAFLVAGANALSVSLWQVPDASTAKLMQELYRLVETRGMTHAAALNQVKREFLAGKHGPEWRAPHYWAPFIFFGGGS